MSKHSSVFIPIVARRREPARGSDPVAGEIIEVLACPRAVADGCRNDVTPLPAEDLIRVDQLAMIKDFDRVAAPLRSRGAALYRAGCAAVGAVYKLGLRRPLLACHQRLRPDAWIAGQRLLAVNAKGPDEGRSAQLGLALALLLGAGAQSGSLVIATGALERDSRSRARSAGQRPNDVEVFPVGELAAKLRLVLDAAEQGVFRQPGMRRRVRFFTPTTLEEDGCSVPVARLPEVTALRKAGVDVIPVRWLSEAADRLGIRRTRLRRADHLCQGLLGTLIVLAFGAFARAGWQHLPIPMRFLTAEPFAESPAPFRVCPSPDGLDRIEPLRTEELVPRLPLGSIIGWRMRIGEADGPDAFLASAVGFSGYHLAHVLISSRSAPLVIRPMDSDHGDGLRISPGGTYAWKWLLNQKAEDNALVVLARRHAPFDLNRLRHALYARFVTGPVADGELSVDVVGAVNYLQAQAPGAISFGFRTVDADAACGAGVETGL